jgi:hypothetical protein
VTVISVTEIKDTPKPARRGAADGEEASVPARGKHEATVGVNLR